MYHSDALVIGGAINSNPEWSQQLKDIAEKYAPGMILQLHICSIPHTNIYVTTITGIKIVQPSGPTAVMSSIKEAVGEP